jgi:hypothetical protein
MKWVEEIRRIWREEVAKERVRREPLSDPKFHALYKRADGPRAWVLANGTSVRLMWLDEPREKNWTELSPLALAGFKPCGLAAMVKGMIETESEDGPEAAAVMRAVVSDFYLEALCRGTKPPAA